MALKKWIDSLEDVPEAFRTEYVKADGADGYVLDLDGDSDDKTKKKLDEFRTNNRTLYGEKTALQQQLDAMKSQFEGVDPSMIEQARKITEAAQVAEEREMLKKGDLEGLLRLKTVKLQAKAEEERNALKTARDAATAERDRYRDQLSAYVIDETAVSEVAKHAKPLDTARADITARARGQFIVNNDGKMEARPGVYGENGESLSLEEWSKGLVNEAPHLFKPASGGGGGGGGEPKPPTKDSSGKLVVDAGDPVAMGRHAEDIASGKAIAR